MIGWGSGIGGGTVGGIEELVRTELVERGTEVSRTGIDLVGWLESDGIVLIGWLAWIELVRIEGKVSRTGIDLIN